MALKRLRKEINRNEQNEPTIKERKFWSGEEDQILRDSVQLHGSNWKLIAEYLDGRNASQCAQRWKRVKPNNKEKNQKWTEQEDQQVKKLTKEFKLNWKIIARYLPNRTGRQIRERYINHLDPCICTKAWTQQEDLKIWTLYQKIGSKWSEMAKKLKGRPENMIKNRFYGYVRKTYAKQENPYYIVPTQKRILKERVKKPLLSINDQEDERFEIALPHSLKKEQQNISNQQQSEFNHFEINSIFQSNDVLSRSGNSNLQGLQQFQAFQKMINYSIENEIMRPDHHFISFQSGESNFHSYNQIFYTPIKEQKYYENNNFVQQVFNSECQSKAVRIRKDIFEELTNNSQNGQFGF